MSNSLQFLLRPRSVAVIGASRERGAIGADVFHNLLTHGFNGPVFPVHPKADSVQSVRAYHTVEEVPDEVELAVVIVPRERALAVADACIRKGVRALVVISAGFAETGAEGKALQDELARRVRAAGVRMVGPNCVGVLNTEATVRLDATFCPVPPPPGPVGFCSHSGALGVVLLDHAAQFSLGISQFVSLGNGADVATTDVLEHWADDASTRVILLYLESIEDPPAFLRMARRVSALKPIVAVKSGRTVAGARAAQSHTDALAGPDAAVDALFAQCGVIRADTFQELLDTGRLLASQPVPAGKRVGILTNAGGPGILATDACERHGLEVPPLGAATQQALGSFLMDVASVTNPVDMISSATPEAYEKAVAAMLADETLEALMVLWVPRVLSEMQGVARAIARSAAGATKPVLVCWVTPQVVPEAAETLRAAGLPAYRLPEEAAAALSRTVQYSSWLAKPRGEVPELADVQPERARVALRGGEGDRWLDPAQVQELLSAYGLAMPRCELVRSAREAAAAAARIAGPVALKLASDTITHKSDLGGVKLGLATPDEAAAAYCSLERRMEELGRLSEMSGALVQEMIPAGVEVLVGMTRLAGYGPLLAFGLGGTAVEVWNDVVFRLAPITDADAREMVGGLKGAKLLDGHRGGPVADRVALADVLLRMSRMAVEHPELQQLDINPLVAGLPGRPPIAVDARVQARRL